MCTGISSSSVVRVKLKSQTSSLTCLNTNLTLNTLQLQLHVPGHCDFNVWCMKVKLSPSKNNPLRERLHFVDHGPWRRLEELAVLLCNKGQLEPTTFPPWRMVS